MLEMSFNFILIKRPSWKTSWSQEMLTLHPWIALVKWKYTKDFILQWVLNLRKVVFVLFPSSLSESWFANTNFWQPDLLYCVVAQVNLFLTLFLLALAAWFTFTGQPLKCYQTACWIGDKHQGLFHSCCHVLKWRHFIFSFNNCREKAMGSISELQFYQSDIQFQTFQSL